MSTSLKALYGLVLAAMFTLGAAISTPQVANAASEVNINGGYAVHGYDVVAYFTKAAPTPGSDSYSATHEGATYRFASAENRDKFLAKPSAYAPQYGGYCAFGTAMGRKFDGDPNAWKIVDNKLYLNLNKGVQERWKKNIPGFIRGANNNWPLIKKVADATLEKSPPSGVTRGAQ